METFKQKKRKKERKNERERKREKENECPRLSPGNVCIIYQTEESKTDFTWIS